MRVLVTGGFGYTGGRLAQWLATDVGATIVLGSRRDVSSPDWLPEASVVTTRWDSDAELEKACEGVDAVFHLAGMNAQDCAADPVGALEVNGGATARLIQAANRQGVGRFIYFSTAHVYDSPLVGTITEKSCPVALHPYATSHRAGEDAVRRSRAPGETRGVVARLSNAYGPPAHKEANCWMLLVNELCRQAATTGGMSLRSSGSQRRDFVPMSEVCRAGSYLLGMASDQIGDGLFNVAGEWSPTVWEMAMLIQERAALVLGRRPELVRMPAAPDESVAELDYRADALRQTGFSIGEDRVTEIDRLLEFCSSSFR